MKYLLLAKLFFLFSIISSANNPDPIVTRGLIVGKVEIGSAYDKVGLKPGDQVLAFDRRPLNSSKNTVDFYKLARAGKIREILVVRNGLQQNIVVKK